VVQVSSNSKLLLHGQPVVRGPELVNSHSGSSGAGMACRVGGGGGGGATGAEETLAEKPWLKPRKGLVRLPFPY
jgi:hypothetical protein